MSYEKITVEQFKSAKPQFANVDDGVVQSYIDLAVIFTGACWPTEESFRASSIMMTCHLMTIDGLGTDPASQFFAKGISEFQSIKSGEITLARYQKMGTAGSYIDWLSSPPCGQAYYQLASMIFRGPLVAVGSIGHGVSP